MYITNITKYDSYMVSLLVARIGNTKPDYDSDIAKDDSLLKGRRYNDNERIARMVLGNIYAEVGFDEAKANAKFISLNSTEMQPYIKAAIIESASADHYYTFEKQWN